MFELQRMNKSVEIVALPDPKPRRDCSQTSNALLFLLFHTSAFWAVRHHAFIDKDGMHNWTREREREKQEKQQQKKHINVAPFIASKIVAICSRDEPTRTWSHLPAEIQILEDDLISVSVKKIVVTFQSTILLCDCFRIRIDEQMNQMYVVPVW